MIPHRLNHRAFAFCGFLVSLKDTGGVISGIKSIPFAVHVVFVNN
jgi:hypothetical protein